LSENTGVIDKKRTLFPIFDGLTVFPAVLSFALLVRAFFLFSKYRNNNQLFSALLGIKITLYLLRKSSMREKVMDVILESKEKIGADLQKFTQNRIHFSLKHLFWMVRKVRVKYFVSKQSSTACNQHCAIEVLTLDNLRIEVDTTAHDKRTALNMALKKVCKYVLQALNKSQQHSRISKKAYA
jgi:hypothetical protein